MKTRFIVAVTAISGVLLAVVPALAQTLTSAPTTTTVVTPARDYATINWQDAWDFDKRTDIGWFTWGSDNPPPNMSARGLFSFGGTPSDASNACGATGSTACKTFKYTPSTTQSKFFTLDTPIPGSAPVGKNGGIKPIDTTVYKYLIYKVRFEKSNTPGQYGAQFGSVPQAAISWSRNSIFPTQTNGGIQSIVTQFNGQGLPGWVFDGDGVDANEWHVYAIRLDQQQWYNSTNSVPYTSAAALWGNSGVTADSFLIEPVTNGDNSNVGITEVDWVRLTEVPATSAQQTIAWTGGTADVLISHVAGCGSATGAGRYTVLAENQSSPFTFPFGALPPGTYYVGLRQAHGQFADVDGIGIVQPVTSCSTGAYVIPDISTFTFTAPSETGSADDFATAFLGNAWDFDATTDFKRTNDINSPSIVNIAAQRPDGTSLGTVPTFKGTSVFRGAVGSGIAGDPHAYLLDFSNNGIYNRIDPLRYRVFSFDLGIDKTRNVHDGSIARLIWHVSGDQTTFNGGRRFLENVSEDLILRHMSIAESGPIIMDRLTFDLKDRSRLPIESDPDGNAALGLETSPSRSGWTLSCLLPWCTPSTAPAYPGIDGFRLDFHEFPDPTDFYVPGIRLAALEETASTYTLRWTASIASLSGLNPRVYFYGNPVVETATNRNPANTGVSLSPTSATCDETALANWAINPGGTSIASGNGSYDWGPAGNFVSGSEYYLCAVVKGTIDGATQVLVRTLTILPVKVNTSYAPKPRLYLNRTALRFSAVFDSANNTFSAVSAPQTIAVSQVGNGSVSWSLLLRDTNGGSAPYLTLSRTTGTGTGTFTLSLTPLAFGAAGNLPTCSPVDGLAHVLRLNTAGTTDNDPQYIEVFVTVRPKNGQACANGLTTTAATAPFGFFDTPAEAAFVTGAVPVTGWAADDIGISRIMILRNCTTVDQAQPPPSPCGAYVPGSTQLFVYIADAQRVADARPDIVAAYPTYPGNYLAGWGYLMLSNGLPHFPTNTMSGGQGPLVLYAFAQDVEGNWASLGAKNVTINNDNATQPFGSIDSPAQGGTFPEAAYPFNNADSYPNFAWAVTQNPKNINVTSTASYVVAIDGVERTLTMNVNFIAGLNRTDVAASFPGRNNTDNSGAVYYINATALGLTNGVHTIAWAAIDSCPSGAPPSCSGGNFGGFGSRYFNILTNSSSPSPSVVPEAGVIDVAAITSPLGRDLGRPARALAMLRTATEPMTIDRPHRKTVATPLAGSVVQIAVDQLERFTVNLPATLGASTWVPYIVRNGELSTLPLGSTFDPATSKLHWQPTLGFLGTYDFIFVRRGSDGRQERLPLTVKVGPDTGRAVSATLPTFSLFRQDR